jgi:hypothetical protein
MKHLILILSLSFLAVACLKEKTVEPEPIPEGPCAETVSFSTELLPEIFDISCNTSGCHDSGTGAAGYVLETHEQISTNANVILDVLQHNLGFVPMPYGGEKLADSLIQKMDCWIEQGQLNN